MREGRRKPSAIMEYIPKAKTKKEKCYIFKRKTIAFFNSLAFYLCRIFPIQKDLISVCTFEGRGGVGCNPKYIVKEIHRQDPGLRFVWFVNKDVFEKKKFPEYIKKVPNTLWNRAYWLGRSAVWIDNYRKPYGTVKRKGQYYVNTWHATMGFKNIGLWRGGAFSPMAYLVSKNDSDMIDDVVVDSQCIADYFRKGLLYDGTYLMVGQPRCDILCGDRTEARKALREKYGIPSDAKIVMFAPTFREGAKDGKRYVFSEVWSIDFPRMIENFEKKFGGKWYLCIRVHPQLAEAADDYQDDRLEGRIINASKEDDMYEILAGVDALVTDYSSVAFDAMYARMPVFIYVDDIEKYSKDRGSLLWNLAPDTKLKVHMNREVTQYDSKLPFLVAKDNEELEENISLFDIKAYERELLEIESCLGYVTGGSASKAVADRILSKIVRKMESDLC